jgi:arylsulfatase A-like enzyme
MSPWHCYGRSTAPAHPIGETLKWMDTNGKGDKPFFLWFNSTAIHIWSHPTQKYIQMAVDEGRAEEDVVRARMLEHDEHVGALLKKLDDLGIANNTIVVYTTDKGNELRFCPMAAMRRSVAKKAPPGRAAFEFPA